MRLNVTAISALDGASVLECWGPQSRPASFAVASNFYLGGVSNATYSVIPPYTVVGLHNAPFAEYVLPPLGLFPACSDSDPHYLNGPGYGLKACPFTG
jgi:hypothetical protein